MSFYVAIGKLWSKRIYCGSRCGRNSKIIGCDTYMWLRKISKILSCVNVWTLR